MRFHIIIFVRAIIYFNETANVHAMEAVFVRLGREKNPLSRYFFFFSRFSSSSFLHRWNHFCRFFFPLTNPHHWITRTHTYKYILAHLPKVRFCIRKPTSECTNTHTQTRRTNEPYFDLHVTWSRAVFFRVFYSGVPLPPPPPPPLPVYVCKCVCVWMGALGRVFVCVYIYVYISWWSWIFHSRITFLVGGVKHEKNKKKQKRQQKHCWTVVEQRWGRGVRVST